MGCLIFIFCCFLSFIMASSLLTDNPPSRGGETTDATALMALKRAITNDPLLSLRDWNYTSNHFCNFTGVKCSNNTHELRVIGINISRMSLNGTIPSHLGNLSLLQSLDLSHNRFTGNIPGALGRLRQLRELYLSANALTGTILHQLGDLKNLQLLASYGNAHTGSIPGTLGNCSMLRKIDLSLNQLTGTIPSEIGLLTRLRFLNLYQNYLTGAIPPSLLNCTELQRLSLTYNGISGPIPSEIGSRLTKLEVLLLFGTNLQGRMSASLMNCSRLWRLEVGSRELTGVIPQALGRLLQLRILILSSSSFITGNNQRGGQVIAKCHGLPLALEVIGTSLYGRHCEEWKTAKDNLSQGQPVSDAHEKALTVMGTSVDILKKEVRECFLDMGIFEEARNISADMLLDLAVYVHGLERAGAYTILIELASRNLVKLVNNQKDTLWDSYEWHCELSFTQHHMLRELAINLTKKEPIELAINLTKKEPIVNNKELIVNRRKRLTMPRKAGVSFRKMWKKHAKREPVFDAEIVSINTGSMQEQDWCHMDFPNIKALILNFSASKYFLPPFMQSMHKLKVLIIINHSSKRATLEGISVLCSLTRLKVVRLERVIVPPLQEYCQSWPKLEKLSFILCEGFKDMTQLNMGWCLNFPRLLEFTIDHCSDLKELPASICQMTSLERLSVTNCHDFYKVLDDIGMLSSLQILRLCGCPSLKEVPDSICKLRQLQFLDISSCFRIKQLPGEIGRLSSLKKLDMRECSHVRHVPVSACHLKPYIQRVICCEQIQRQWSQMIGSGKVEAAEEKFSLDWLDG